MILIGTDDGIYRWYEGAGWPVFHSLQNRSIVGLSAPGPGMLIALDHEGAIFETANNGQEWRSIPLAAGCGHPTTLTAWGNPPCVVLASRSSSMWRRPFGAATPALVEAGATAPSRLSQTLSRTGAGKGLLTPGRWAAAPDRTVGWTRLGPLSTGKPSTGKSSGGKGSSAKGEKGAGQGSEVRALARLEGTPAPWFAAAKGAGLWRSTDQGASWKPCPGLTAEVQAIRPVPERPGTLYVATSDGCWLSTDAGQSWEERSGGLENARYLSAIEVKPGAPDVLLAGAAAQGPNETAATPYQGLEFSLYESKDGGKTWSLVRRGNPDRFENDLITDLRHDPAAPDNIVMALASGELWMTPNAGAFWTPLARKIRAARVLCPIA